MAEMKLTSPEWSARTNGGGEPVLVIKESGCVVEIRSMGDISIIIRSLVEYEVLRRKEGAA